MNDHVTPTTLGRPGGQVSHERGAMSVEAVLVVPVFFTIVFLIVNAGIWLQAGNLAQSAASGGYHAARLYEATTGDGETAARAIATSGGNVLQGVGVSVDRGAETVTVTVTGTAPLIVPGLELDVSRTVSGPAERWVD